ncbi:MAG: hypothetical protein OXC30_05780 [Alphaproteobacteria bacterium]|nr:hypothetical protein [Alphaproteobacteria bacterium]
MIHLLLAALLISCAHNKQNSPTRYTHNATTIPLLISNISVAFPENMDGHTIKEVDSLGICGALTEWSQKRFQTHGDGTMRVMVTTEKVPTTGPITKNFWNHNALIITIHITGSSLYTDVKLRIKAHRSMNIFRYGPPKHGTPAWAEFMTNLINSVDAQVVSGLQKYAPKLLVHN